jgi:alpha-beta hydrolase superfamily lysophospholipase
MIRLEAEGEATLALYCQRAPAELGDVIYVHGSTFGADLSVLFKFDDRSWADALCEAGLNVWAFDFAGYGSSDCYPQDGEAPVGGIEQVLPQLRRVIAAVRARNGGRPVSLLAHSWGGTAALRYAGDARDELASLVLFAPITTRLISPEPPAAPASSHFLLTSWAQYRRFIEDVPRGEAQMLSEAHFQTWSAVFLASDPEASKRMPPSVRTPSGPQHDLRALRCGQALYNAAAITVPTLVVRGEWDGAFDTTDAQHLMNTLGSTDKTCVHLPRGTHLMHLESGRGLLYNAVNAFLSKVAR